jgi:hypothetical protein
LEEWAKKRGSKHRCVIVARRSRKNDVELQCNRRGEHKSRAPVRRTWSIIKACPFKFIRRYIGKSDCWRLEVIDETHNHDAVGFEKGHAYNRKLSAEEFDLVATLFR